MFIFLLLLILLKPILIYKEKYNTQMAAVYFSIGKCQGKPNKQFVEHESDKVN